MSEFDGDANATPLAKLPPPMMQSKSGAPQNPPAYADMIKEAQHSGGHGQHMMGGGGGMGGGGPRPGFGPPPPSFQSMQPQQPQMHEMGGGGHQQQEEEDDDEQMQMMAHHLQRQQAQMQAMARQMQAQQAQLAKGGGGGKAKSKGAAKGGKESFAALEEPAAAAPGSNWRDWKTYTPALLVAAIVLLMLVYGVPKVKSLVPQLVNPVGRLSYAGLGVVALLSGGLFQATSKFAL